MKIELNKKYMFRVSNYFINFRFTLFDKHVEYRSIYELSKDVLLQSDDEKNFPILHMHQARTKIVKYVIGEVVEIEHHPSLIEITLKKDSIKFIYEDREK